MPATSRSGESGGRRSASGLAGSPSKSTIFQPFDVRRVWPRWRSPCTRWTAPARSSRASRRSARAVPAACSAQLGHDVAARRRAARHRCGQRRAGRRRSAPRREALGQQRVHLGGRLARAARPRREVAADLVGVQVGLGEQVAHDWPARAPSRRSRSRRNCCSIASCTGRVALGSATRASRERGDVLATRPGEALRGSRCRGCVPGRDPAEDLQQRRRSPNATEELDCSPVERRRGCRRGPGSSPGSRWNSSGPSGGRRRTPAARYVAMASRSCTAS